MLKLNSVLIGSSDPQKLADFYAQVFATKPGWEGNGFTGFDAGGTYLMVGPHDKVHSANPNPERILINFEAADFEAEFKRISSIAGIKVIQEPYHPGAEQQMLLATFADPDGNYFQLATPMA
jgi:predicted enzyme related to lactoylglutathione lyase